MTIQNAFDAYEAASTEADINAAYEAIIEHIAEDLDDDADFESVADIAINERGLPSLSSKLIAAQF